MLGQNKEIVSLEIIKTTLPLIYDLIIITVLSILILYYLINKISKPIEQLAIAANDITNNKQFYFDHSKYEEINILSNKLNTISHIQDQLRQANIAINIANEGLEQKVQERTAELKSALAAKSEFLNNMSHEIRAPINGFLILAEITADHWDKISEEERLYNMQAIVSSAKRIASLVGHLLDLAKFDKGEMSFTYHNIDFVETINEIIEESETLYLTKKNIKIKFINNTNQDNIIIEADEERIAQVLRNLVVNASKFSPEDSIITIFLDKVLLNYGDDESAVGLYCRIQDQGIGIPEDQLKTIFEAFVMSTRTKTKAGGTGLGLAIVTQIIKGHQGKIWATNNQDQGVSFHMLIPLQQQQQLKEIMDYRIINEPKKVLTINKEAELTKAPLRSLNILSIDDEQIVLQSMGLLLKTLGHHSFSAVGGIEGLKFLRETQVKIDLVFLDLMMPDMYGLNVLEEIRKDPALKHLKVILKSGTSDRAEINKAYNLGIIAYISKLSKIQTTIDAINKVAAIG